MLDFVLWREEELFITLDEAVLPPLVNSFFNVYLSPAIANEASPIVKIIGIVFME